MTIRLSYLIPTNQYEFFGELVDPLRAAGIDVTVNAISSTTDLVLAGILPATPQWIGPLTRCGKPFVLWHWDLYSFVDYREPRWQAFLEMLPQAADVWSCGYEVARQLKEQQGLDSYVVPAWIDSSRLPADRPRGDYAFYASGNGFGKRVDWAERACSLLGIKLRVAAGQSLPRHEYLDLLAGCRVYLMTAFEESNGTIPAMEAAACGRPVVLADLPASLEVFGATGRYFRNWDFGDLLRTLRLTWAQGIPHDGGRDRIIAGYDLPVISRRIVERLRSLHVDVYHTARPTG